MVDDLDESDTGILKSSGSINGLFYRFFLIFLVFLSVIVWPEPLSIQGLIASIFFPLFIAFSCNRNFCHLFICTFFISLTIAFFVFFLLNPLDLFASSYQDAKATDSQFYLYEARRFIYEGDVTALFSTWGSLVPVFYGVVALKLFGGSYIGIIFFNSLIYSISVFFGARLINIQKCSYRLLPILGLMPAQGFYNSMLAKEPIYLFLVVMALYLVTQAISYKKKSAIVVMQLLMFFLLTLVLVIFRPTGAVILTIVAFVYLFREKGLRIVGAFIPLFLIVALFAIFLATMMQYSIPLFFLSEGGEVSFLDHNELSLQHISAHMNMIPEFMAPFFIPPFSILAIPILLPVWMISPLPFYTLFFDSINNLFTGRLTFFDFAVFIRYFDALIIVLMLIRLSRKKIKIIFSSNPLILFSFLQVLAIVSLQFFESGRHRYLPGFILALLVIYSFKQDGKIKPGKYL